MKTVNFRFVLAVFIALSLSIIPLPELISGFRPPWVLMLVLYVQFYMPRYFRVTWVFLVGLALDVLLVSVFGEHAFALLLTSCLAASKTRRFSFFSTSQQMLLITLFCVIYELIFVLMEASMSYPAHMIPAMITVLITMVLWPWLKLVADNTLWVNQ